MPRFYSLMRLYVSAAFLLTSLHGTFALTSDDPSSVTFVEETKPLTESQLDQKFRQLLDERELQQQQQQQQGVSWAGLPGMADTQQSGNMNGRPQMTMMRRRMRHNKGAKAVKGTKSSGGMRMKMMVMKMNMKMKMNMMMMRPMMGNMMMMMVTMNQGPMVTNMAMQMKPTINFALLHRGHAMGRKMMGRRRAVSKGAKKTKGSKGM